MEGESVSSLTEEDDEDNTFSSQQFKHKINYISMKHSLKRILKACQIQLDDFQWKNGPYKESSFETLAKKDSTEQIQQSEPEVPEREIKDDENSDNNIMRGEDSLSQDANEMAEISVPQDEKIGIVEELVKRRTQILKEIIEIEQ